ncbi:MAG: glycoside hydrolase family 1 protein [Bdellovibrionales bacterium]|nr:glycoside hydrolase family 1 protein [Bdellovibrionales bacterium]
MRKMTFGYGFGALAAVTACLGSARAGSLLDDDLEFVSFPPGFKWCVGVSSHQHEGMNINSDWWAFEQDHDDVPESGVAVDHWNRFREDHRLAKNLGVSQFRMTLEWARIEPREGVVDAGAVEHYREAVAHLEGLGIEPLLTLHQLTLPKWFEDRGGFSWEGAPQAFARFARLAATRIAPRVRWWTTSVDGAIHLFVGHATDLIPPSRNDIASLGPAIVGFLRTHAAAYRALHEARKGSNHPVQVGIVHFVRLFDPKRVWNPIDHLGARMLNQAFNWMLSDAIQTGRVRLSIPFTFHLDERIPEARGTQDFIGINYYTRNLVELNPLQGDLPGQIAHALTAVRPGAPVTDMGWEIYPRGMYRTLMEARRRYPGVPFYITEGGLADATDDLRPAYMRSYLGELRRAMDADVPVLGYCHWSLTDNFEWREGFVPRFGLYGVDYETLQRTPRPSARLVRDISLANGFWRQSARK